MSARVENNKQEASGRNSWTRQAIAWCKATRLGGRGTIGKSQAEVTAT